MKIALAQQNYIIGDFDHNFEKIKSAILAAKEAGADLVVFVSCLFVDTHQETFWSLGTL